MTLVMISGSENLDLTLVMSVSQTLNIYKTD